MQQYQIYLEEQKRPKEKFASTKDIQPFLDSSSFSMKMKMLSEELQKKRMYLSITFCYWFQKNFCPKCWYSERTKLIDHVNDRMECDLDVNAIMDRLNQIEQLKRVVLNDEQLNVFEFAKRKRLTQKFYLEITTDLQRHDQLVGSFQKILDEDVDALEKK